VVKHQSYDCGSVIRVWGISELVCFFFTYPVAPPPLLQIQTPWRLGTRAGVPLQSSGSFGGSDFKLQRRWQRIPLKSFCTIARHPSWVEFEFDREKILPKYWITCPQDWCKCMYHWLISTTCLIKFGRSNDWYCSWWATPSCLVWLTLDLEGCRRCHDKRFDLQSGSFSSHNSILLICLTCFTFANRELWDCPKQLNRGGSFGDKASLPFDFVKILQYLTSFVACLPEGTMVNQRGFQENWYPGLKTFTLGIHCKVFGMNFFCQSTT